MSAEDIRDRIAVAERGVTPRRRVVRRIAMGGVGVLALSLVASGHLYVIRRLILDPGMASPVSGLLVSGVWALGLGLVLEPFIQRIAPRRLARWVAWPVLSWMGLFFLLIVGLLASDLVLWLLAPASPGTASQIRALLVAGLAVAAAGVGLISALRVPRIRRIELRPARWPRELDGLRIVQLSDLHVGPLLGRDFVRSVVERAVALDADLIAVTGDVVDGSVERLRDEVEPLGGLRAPLGVFFVTGNHDHYSSEGDWVEVLEGLGIRALRNARVPIHHRGSTFDLGGVDDYRGGWGGTTHDLEAALRGRDVTRPLILLAHDPSGFRQAAAAGVDLQLSGHTHAGQIWPFRYAVRMAVSFVAGPYRLGESLLYVSRGTGFWGPPMRLLAPAEITEITLRAG